MKIWTLIKHASGVAAKDLKPSAFAEHLEVVQSSIEPQIKYPFKLVAVVCLLLLMPFTTLTILSAPPPI
jgi:hypothetical protein